MKLKRYLSVFLVLVMCLLLIPASVIAIDAEEAPATEYEYVTSIGWDKSAGDMTPLFVRSEEYPYIKEFAFDPAVKVYDLVIPWVSVNTSANFRVEFTDAAKEASNIYGRVSEISQSGEKKYIYGAKAADFTSLGSTSDGLGLVRHPQLGMDSTYPCTIQLETGVLEDGEDIQTAELTNQGSVYTFRIYSCAAMMSLKVAYEDGTSILSQNYMRPVYGTIPNVVIESVKAGTEKLIFTATYSGYSASPVLKFDDGTGEFVADAEDTTGKKFTLDLTKYGADYKKSDGSMVIPFMIDYAQPEGGCSLDGYFTLILTFAEPENSEIEPKTASFDKGKDDDSISVALTLYGNILKGIWNGDTQLVEGEAYTIDGETVTLLKSWLTTLPVGATTLTFKFSAGEDQTLVVSVSDSSTSSSFNGYVKNITIADSDQFSDHVYFAGFDKDQPTYTLGTIPDRGYLPDILLALENEENISKMRCSLTLISADETIITTGSGEFKKHSNIYDDVTGTFKLLGLVSNVASFNEKEPGNYSLIINVYEDGHEDSGDKYIFNFMLVPFMSSLSISANGKQVLTDPDISNMYDKETQKTVLFNREYCAEVQGSYELNLHLTVWDWLNDYYYGDASTGVSLLFNGETTMAHFTQEDQAPTIDTTIDFSNCDNSGGVYTAKFSLVYGESDMAVRNDYTLYITVSEDSGWQITDYSQGGVYDKGDTVTISVTVEGAKADNVTYRWQWTELHRGAENGRYRGDIENENDSTLTVPTNSSGRRFYRCIVTDKDTGAFQCTNMIVVDVNVGQINAPIILCQPGQEAGAKTEYLWGEAIRIQATAGTTDMIPADSLEWAAETNIEWYENVTASTSGATLLASEYYTQNKTTDVPALAVFSDRIDAYIFTYTIPNNLDAGDYYFFCVVTATAKDDSENKASVTSAILKITVSERGELEGFEGSGTEADPYLIKSVEELRKIDEYVMGGDALTGAYFRFANDVTIPSDYESIGTIAPFTPFSGTIDGNGKTLSYEKGARPLLECCRDAYVKNLYIFGEEINGAGLLDKATVDYGEDGVYQETDPDIITIENVTLLSGSKTTGSGLVNGGYTSGINNIFIKNCCIEENVVVGCNKDQSDIGSFVGTLNGRIENSISYATVYGISNVGGLAGKKGQSVGLCEIINSAFIGTVEAQEGRAGGIIGAGYIIDNAPNSPTVTVRNCYVVADIIGNSAASFSAPNYGAVYTAYYSGDFDNGSGIGGILGSDIGVLGPWDNAYICDNYFYGTITDTNPDSDTRNNRVGGIVGELGAYEPSVVHCENNYYLVNIYNGLGYLLIPFEDWNPNQDSFIAKTAEEFANGTVTALLNQGAYKNWVTGPDGYPIHSDAVIATSLTISGNYKATYFIGDELDMTDAVFTVGYSDGTEKNVGAADVSFTGFDSSALGVYTVTATWGPVSATFDIRVILENPDAITVSFVLYGDTAHGDNGEIHTLDESNLTVWIARADYEINENTTVLDVFTQAARNAGLTWVNDDGNYISSITNGDIMLAEFTNGRNSGWMYILNGVHPKNGVAQQFLSEGDCILFHYTDDYTKEGGMTDVSIRNMKMDTETFTVKAGETKELSVSFEPALLNGNVRIDWTSADTGIATVKNGVVTGLSEGETTITAEAKDAGFHVTATVTVTPGDGVVQVESVTISPETLTLTEGETGTLTATVLPENATSKDVQWSSSDESVATVSSKGVVTAVKAGTATITATAGGKSATVTITVEAEEIAVTGVTLNKTSVSVTEEETVTLKATVTPSNATNKTVTWSSSDEDVATVDENGVVTGVSAGTATITAQVGTYSATCEVTVNAADKTVKNLNIVDDENADNFANVTSSVETTIDGEGNKTKTAALTVDSTRISDEGEVEDIPCMVIVKNPDGSYERLEAKANPDGSYTFVKENYSEDMEFFVAVMGDTNLDGKLSIADMLLARAAMLGKVSLDDLAFMVSDLDGVNGLTIADILKARAYSLNMTTLDW